MTRSSGIWRSLASVKVDGFTGALVESSVCEPLQTCVEAATAAAEKQITTIAINVARLLAIARMGLQAHSNAEEKFLATA